MRSKLRQKCLRKKKLKIKTLVETVELMLGDKAVLNETMKRAQSINSNREWRVHIKTYTHTQQEFIKKKTQNICLSYCYDLRFGCFPFHITFELRRKYFLSNN